MNVDNQKGELIYTEGSLAKTRGTNEELRQKIAALEKKNKQIMTDRMIGRKELEKGYASH